MSRSPMFNTECTICNTLITQEVGVQSFIIESRGAEIEEKCGSCHSALVKQPPAFLEFEIISCKKCTLRVVELIDSLIKESNRENKKD